MWLKLRISLHPTWLALTVAGAVKPKARVPPVMPMWAPVHANLNGLHEAYTSCPRPSSCGAWNGSARLSRDAGEQLGLGPVPLIQLIGTRKGGTTALSDHMLAHPHLLAPDCRTHKRDWPRVAQSKMCVWDKEVRYFSRGFRRVQAQSLESVDLCWYRSLYPCVPVGAPHVGFDGSPDYLTMPEDKVAAQASHRGPSFTPCVPGFTLCLPLPVLPGSSSGLSRAVRSWLGASSATKRITSLRSPLERREPCTPRAT